MSQTQKRNSLSKDVQIQKTMQGEPSATDNILVKGANHPRTKVTIISATAAHPDKAFIKDRTWGKCSQISCQLNSGAHVNAIPRKLYELLKFSDLIVSIIQKLFGYGGQQLDVKVHVLQHVSTQRTNGLHPRGTTSV